MSERERERQEFFINRIHLADLCILALYCTGGKSKQISQGKLNTIVKLTVTSLLYTHKYTDTIPLPPVNDPFWFGRNCLLLTPTGVVHILRKNVLCNSCDLYSWSESSNTIKYLHTYINIHGIMPLHSYINLHKNIYYKTYNILPHMTHFYSFNFILIWNLCFPSKASNNLYSINN